MKNPLTKGILETYAVLVIVTCIALVIFGEGHSRYTGAIGLVLLFGVYCEHLSRGERVMPDMEAPNDADAAKEAKARREGLFSPVGDDDLEVQRMEGEGGAPYQRRPFGFPKGEREDQE